MGEETRVLTLGEGHRYYLDGAELASVSSVLNVIAPYQSSYGDNEIAMLRGTAVHMATEYADRGTLDPDSLDPSIKGYLDGWLNYRRISGFVPTEMEQRVADPLLCVAGTYDRLGRIGDKTVLLDIKSGPHHWRYDVQVTAYDYLRQKWHRAPAADELVTVCLTADGSFRLHYASERSNFLNIFIAGVTILHARTTYGG